MKKAVFGGVIAVVAVLLLVAGCAPAGKYKNGSYKATYDAFDPYGWKAQLEVTVKSGKIDAATFDYVNKQGQLKTQDQGYAAAMKKQANTTPADASAALVKGLIAKQASGVDAVTGATETSASFNAMAEAILAKAITGDTTPTVLVQNGTYTASAADFDSHGWKPQLSVTFDNGKITAVKYDETNKDKKLKSEDAGYAAQMLKVAKTTPKDAYAKLDQALIDKQNPDQVDAVSGATETSKGFVTLAKQILASR